MADNIRATPRNPVLGLFSDITQGGLDYLRDPRFRQSMMQLPAPVRPFGMGAVALPGLFESTGFPKTLERAAYGEPLTNIGMANVPTLKPETADLLMNVAPLAPAALRGAAATGRFVAPKAGQLAEQYMVRTGGILPLDVYHGTPHTLPPTPRNPLGEFDASKIGTGEGAAAFGHGIYTAEARPVAEEYAKNLANADKFNQGRLTAHANAKRLAELTGSPEYAADDIRFVLESNPNHDQKKLLTETLNFLESGDYKKPLENKGNLYKIDLPDEKIAQMLDWDRPVSEQINVMNALRNTAEKQVKDRILINIENDIRSQMPVQNIGNDYSLLFSNNNISINQDIRKKALSKLNELDLTPLIDKELDTLKPLGMNWDMSGKDLYEMLATRNSSPVKASSILQEQGIPGIKYLDEGSRGSTGAGRWKLKFPNGDEKIYNFKPDDDVLKQMGATAELYGTRNFVTFPGEEQNLRILERNNQRANELDYPSNPMYTDPLGYSIR